jgi:Protein of unknown function (DUF3618)
MDQDQSTAGQELAEEPERTPELVRDEIEQSRAELGDTVAALSAKTDVKGQAKQAVTEAKETVTDKASDIKGTVADKKDEFVASAHQATPESISDAGQRGAAFARENSVQLSILAGVLATFGLGVLLGRRTTR